MSKQPAKVKQEEEEVEAQKEAEPQVEVSLQVPSNSLDVKEAFLPSQTQPLVILEFPTVKSEESEQPKKKRKLPKRGTPSQCYLNSLPPKEDSEPDSDNFDWSKWDSFRDYDV